MKQITRLYQNNPVIAFLFDCIAFFVWAVTFIFIITIMAVALSA
jgi:hypothetical protein